MLGILQPRPGFPALLIVAVRVHAPDFPFKREQSQGTVLAPRAGAFRFPWLPGESFRYFRFFVVFRRACLGEDDQGAAMPFFQFPGAQADDEVVGAFTLRDHRFEGFTGVSIRPAAYPRFQTDFGPDVSLQFPGQCMQIHERVRNRGVPWRGGFVPVPLRTTGPGTPAVTVKAFSSSSLEPIR